MKYCILFILAALLNAPPLVAEVLPSPPVSVKFARQMHVAEFQSIFGSSPVSDEIFETVSRFMDDAAKNDFLSVFPEAKVLHPGWVTGVGGDHRIMGHVLGGGYNREAAIRRIMDKTGLSHETVSRRLIAYNKRSYGVLVAKLRDIWGIPPQQAKRIVHICADIHLLGDLNTHDIKSVATFKRIVTDLHRNLRPFIGKAEAFEILKDLRQVLAKGNELKNSEVYRQLKQVLRSSHLSSRWQKTMSELVQVGKHQTIQSVTGSLRNPYVKQLLIKIINGQTVRTAAKFIQKSGGVRVLTRLLSKKGKRLLKYAKVVPYVVDGAFWCIDVYDSYSEYKECEISYPEFREKVARATGLAAGTAGGFAGGYKVGKMLGVCLPVPGASEVVGLVGGIAGAAVGGSAGGWSGEKFNQLLVGTPYEACLKDALNGDARAMYFMGLYNRDGRWRERPDTETAIRWLERASDCHFSRASHALGDLYANLNCGTNAVKALVYWRKAVDEGLTTASLNLAKSYMAGFGSSRSSRTAIYHLKKAVDDGVEGAQNYVDELYGSLSVGTIEDLDVGFLAELLDSGLFPSSGNSKEKRQDVGELYDAAVLQGDSLAQCWLAVQKLSADQESSMDDLFDSANDGCAEAQLWMAYLYAHDRDDEQDESSYWLSEFASSDLTDGFNELMPRNHEVVQWIASASSNGNAFAKIAYGRMLVEGYCVDRNLEKGMELLKSALPAQPVTAASVIASYCAENNVPVYLGKSEMETLRYAYVVGDLDAGIELARVMAIDPRRRAEAVGMLQKVLSEADSQWVRSSVDAEAMLGECLLYGLGTEVDITIGRKKLEAAAQAGSVRGLFVLGHELLLGGVLERDVQYAIECLSCAANLGSAEASRTLTSVYASGTFVPRDDGASKYYAQLGAVLEQGKWSPLCKVLPRSCLYKGRGVAAQYLLDWYDQSDNDWNDDDRRSAFHLICNFGNEPPPSGAVGEFCKAVMAADVCTGFQCKKDEKLANELRAQCLHLTPEEMTVYRQLILQCVKKSFAGVNIPFGDGFYVRGLGSGIPDGKAVRMSEEITKRELFLPGILPEDIMVLLDESFWGGARKGGAITTWGFFYLGEDSPDGKDDSFGCEINKNLIVDWERKVGGVIFVDGKRCKLIVESRKPFVEAFRRVIEDFPEWPVGAAQRSEKVAP